LISTLCRRCPWLYEKALAWRPSLAAAAGAGGPANVTIIQFSDAGKPTGKVNIPKVVRPDAEWKQKLAPVSFDVTRHEGTERPYTGSTWNNHDHGFYRCICCDNAVFSSDTKFESGTGWPSFWQPIAKENIVEIRDMSLGWNALRFPAASATLILAMFSMTALDQPVCVTA